ncbi:MAG TPA: AsmA-like C-terminal region-containing protein [Cellvibrio sp.]|nr:AsmA-like C-terminal region-containing protein [Cellvibrio sp.]
MSRALRKLVKWFYFLIALTLILLAVLVQSGRSFSHLLGDYEQNIANYFSSKLNAQVNIGQIESDWTGLKPSIVIQDFSIKSYSGQPIIALEQARLRLDILDSLLNLRPVWSNLILQQVDVSFAQTEEGFWQIPGLPHLAKPDEEKRDQRAQLDALIDMLLLSTRIEFQRSHINFAFNSGQQMVLDSPYLLLENADDFHRLSLQIDVDEQPRSIFMVMEGNGDPRDQQHFHSKGYLQLNRFPTSEPIAAASAFLLGGKSVVNAEGQVDANIWFETRKEGKGYDLIGSLGVQRLSIPLGERHLALDDFATELAGFWLPGGEWRLGLQQINAAMKEQQISGVNIAATSTGFQQPVKVNLDSIDLERLNHILDDAGVLGTGRLQEVFKTLDPRGHLRNIQLSLPIKQPKEWQLRANLNQVAVNAWQGVPALVGVDGYVQAGQQGGFVDIDARQRFSMHYNPTYSAPMVYDSAKGQIAWHLQREKNQIYVNSGLLEFRQGEEIARGYMWLGLPWQRNTGDIDLFLQVGGQNLNASKYKKYTPATVPASLAEWLAKSVGLDNPGKATEAGFVYRGTLNTKNPMARTYQLYLNLEQTSLNYHPGWPALAELDGRLLITDAQVAASVSAAKVFESQLTQAEVRANPLAQGRGSLLQIKGQIKGPASDGIRVLREGEMRKYMGASLDSWAMQGQMNAQLDLDIPIGTGEEKSVGHRQQVDVDLQAPLFELQNLNLSVTDLSGRISYNSDTGVSSRELRGHVFDQLLQAQLNTQKLEGFNKTLISLDGKVEARKLAFWSNRPEVLFMEGNLPYQMMVELNHRPRSTITPELRPDTQEEIAVTPAAFASEAFASITVTSNLQGVNVDLPAPYGKKAEELRPFVFQYWLQDIQSQVHLAYGDDVQALLRMDRRRNHLLTANIALGKDTKPSHNAEFLVSGYVPSVELDPWKAVQAKYLAYTEQLAPVVVNSLQNPGSPQEIEDMLATKSAEVGKIAGLPFRTDLVVGRYELGSLNLTDLSVVAVPVQTGWYLQVNNPQVAGELTIPSNQFTPLDVKLEYLTITKEALGQVEEADSGTEPVEPAGDRLLDPRKLPLANISINNLSYDADNFGSWSLQLRPNSKGVAIENIRGAIRGVTVHGADEKQGAQMFWQYTPQGMQTRFIGTLVAGDMGAVLREWEKPDTIESQLARFNADLFWRGSPQDFQIVELGGEMKIHMQNGRFKREANAGDGVLRLLSILNFDSLARRMRLDFSDLYKSGLAYDDINGKVRFNQGTVVFEEPLLVRTPSSGLQMAGTINLRDETIDTRLVATLPVASNLTFFAALATGLPAAAGVYLVSKLFKKQVDQATSISYTIEGNWDQPRMSFDRLFESEKSLRDSVARKKKPPANEGASPQSQ